jgi:hypothetical protein
MLAVVDYLKHALDCRTLAERMTQPDDKSILKEIAKTWEKIAAFRQRDLRDAISSNRG